MTELVQLQTLNKRFIHNYVTNDVASHDAILHPAFSYMSAAGRRVDRATYLEAWATGFDPAIITYWDMRDETITIADNTALVRATNKFTEAGVTGMACYTDVYVKEGGKWLCIHAQISNVAEIHWPNDETVVVSYDRGVLR